MPPWIGWDYCFVRQHLTPADNESNKITMIPPTSDKLPAQPRRFHRRNHCPQTAASDKDLLPPQLLQFVNARLPAENDDRQYWTF